MGVFFKYIYIYKDRHTLCSPGFGHNSVLAQLTEVLFAPFILTNEMKLLAPVLRQNDILSHGNNSK